MTTLLVALGGLILAVLGAAAVDSRQAGMKKWVAVGALAATLGLAGLPADAQTRSAGVRSAASYSAPVSGHDGAAPARSANRATGQKCWYVLDVLLCD